MGIKLFCNVVQQRWSQCHVKVCIVVKTCSCAQVLMGFHQDQEYDQYKKLQLGCAALVSVMWKFAS